MPVIDIEKAKTHLRVDDDAGDDVAIKLASAIDIAEQYLNRKIYESAQSLKDAKSTIPALVNEATQQYGESIANAQGILDHSFQKSAIEAAKSNKDDALRAVRMVELGIVVNPSLEIGVLMLLGHLYANREDVVAGLSVAELPKSSESFLVPYRKDLGV